jgi:formylmethanofuran dehydrogenase subunit E
MGMFAGTLLELDLPQKKKRLLTIVEMDGCFADGVSTATNCWVRRRTLRVVAFGKTAATFIDTRTETAVRLSPTHNIRELAPDYAPTARNRWEGYLLGYQEMPVHLMFDVQPVELTVPVAQIVSRAGIRVNCDRCGEEIINEREVVQNGIVLCRDCAEDAYYVRVPEGITPEIIQTNKLPESSIHFKRANINSANVARFITGGVFNGLVAFEVLN